MTPTGKGAFLTAGIALLSTGTMLVDKNLLVGLVCLVAGAGFIFGREFLKE